MLPIIILPLRLLGRINALPYLAWAWDLLPSTTRNICGYSPIEPLEEAYVVLCGVLRLRAVNLAFAVTLQGNKLMASERLDACITLL